MGHNTLTADVTMGPYATGASVENKPQNRWGWIPIISESIHSKSMKISNLDDYHDTLRTLQCFGKRASAKSALTMLLDRKSTRLNSSHIQKSRMPSSA